jgi:hypothetical protein
MLSFESVSIGYLQRIAALFWVAPPLWKDAPVKGISRLTGTARNAVFQ